MNKKDFDFQMYLYNLDLIDISNAYSILENIPTEVDDDIKEAVIDVLTSVTENFLKDIKKLNVPKKEVADIIKKKDEILNSVNASNTHNNSESSSQDNYESRNLSNELYNLFDESKHDNTDKSKSFCKNQKLKVSKSDSKKWYDYYKKWLNATDEEYTNKLQNLQKESFGELIFFREDNDETAIFELVNSDRKHKDSEKSVKERIQVLLKSTCQQKNHIQLTNSFLSNHIPSKISQNEINTWYNYYQQWITSTESEYTKKLQSLDLNIDGTLISHENIQPDIERNILKFVIISKNYNKTLTEETIKKIIAYELLHIEAEKINITQDQIDYWYGYYNNWKESSNLKYKIKKATLKLKEKILNHTNEEITIFNYLIIDFKEKEIKLKNTITTTLQNERQRRLKASMKQK